MNSTGPSDGDTFTTRVVEGVEVGWPTFADDPPPPSTEENLEDEEEENP